MSAPKFFYYNDSLYLRIIPAKRLFQSTLVHEVVTRGDVFAVHMETGQFTIVPGKASVIVVTPPPYSIPPLNSPTSLLGALDAAFNQPSGLEKFK